MLWPSLRSGMAVRRAEREPPAITMWRGSGGGAEVMVALAWRWMDLDAEGLILCKLIVEMVRREARPGDTFEQILGSSRIARCKIDGLRYHD